MSGIPERPPYRLIPDWPVIFFLLVVAALVMWSDLLGCLAWLVGCSFGYVLAVYEHATDNAPSRMVDNRRLDGE